MPAGPSATMLKALSLASEAGLVRLRGGFWTSPDCPTTKRDLGGARPHDVPDSWVDIRTVDACVRRGFLVRGTDYDAPASLTEAGRALLPDEPSPKGP